MTGVQFPAGVMMGFSSLCHGVQTGFGAHPTCHPISTGVYYAGGKAAAA